MRPEQLRQFTTAVPFRPFRIVTTDGRSFEVHHPDMVIVGVHVVIIGIPEAGGVFAERTITISLVHVVSLEPLQPVPA
jgi:hypothetical protein